MVGDLGHSTTMRSTPPSSRSSPGAGGLVAWAAARGTVAKALITAWAVPGSVTRSSATSRKARAALIISTAAVWTVVGEFSAALLQWPDGGAAAIAAAVACGFAAVQWRGIRAGSRVQNVTSALKAVAVLVLVAGAFPLGRGAESTRPALRASAS